MKDKKQTILAYPSQNVMVISLVVIGAIAFYNWFVSPHRNYLLAAQRQELVATDLLKKNQVINNTIAINKNELEELQGKFKQACIGLFSDVEATKFFSNIQTLVENANYTVNSLKFLPTYTVGKGDESEKTNYVVTRQVKLSVLGDYGNIILLMSKLQDRPERVQIDTVVVKPTISDSDLLQCDMNITIYVIENKE
ncbi:MAG TPA: hypothetical protein PLP05_07110 [Sedimentisphaerales bacterium]|nr:hypothetical protein [Sedimentisphaerales bacterium]